MTLSGGGSASDMSGQTVLTAEDVDIDVVGEGDDGLEEKDSDAGCDSPPGPPELRLDEADEVTPAAPRHGQPQPPHQQPLALPKEAAGAGAGPGGEAGRVRADGGKGGAGGEEGGGSGGGRRRARRGGRPGPEQAQEQPGEAALLVHRAHHHGHPAEPAEEADPERHLRVHQQPLPLLPGEVPRLAEQHPPQPLAQRLLRQDPPRAGQPGQGQLLDPGPAVRGHVRQRQLPAAPEALQAPPAGAPARADGAHDAELRRLQPGGGGGRRGALRPPLRPAPRGRGRRLHAPGG
uniref:Uncharacterized protein n=1 Tax=Equus asinus TaxID=9793 RepID=A0A9L0IKJ2_EQUAS